MSPEAESWSAPISAIVRFLRKAGCRRDADSLVHRKGWVLDAETLAQEMSALRVLLSHLASLVDEPPAQMTTDQQEELRELLRAAHQRARQRLVELADDARTTTNLAKIEGISYDSTPPAAPSAAPVGEHEAAQRANGRRVVGRNINARMLETMQANEEALGWNSRQWAEHLKCAKSSVVETQTWKDLSMRRERERAERAQDRRRRPKGSDQRRD